MANSNTSPASSHRIFMGHNRRCSNSPVEPTGSVGNAVNSAKSDQQLSDRDRPDGQTTKTDLSMPDSLPGNGPDTLFLIVGRVMHLFPLLCSRQRPVVEPEPLIRETF